MCSVRYAIHSLLLQVMYTPSCFCWIKINKKNARSIKYTFCHLFVENTLKTFWIILTNYFVIKHFADILIYSIITSIYKITKIYKGDTVFIWVLLVRLDYEKHAKRFSTSSVFPSTIEKLEEQKVTSEKKKLVQK